ncbi:hypothetical protein EUX98_g4785 [Antrodiella citrinella]|uniref:Uncharacterized protein n=1 Tax=Antrodiella citrinella TaxID=2447956 RepID=A0A4S4MT66_9APHY|nr:hypothetical protein EUX98_g4785 [Antrodiella citrinella]
MPVMKRKLGELPPPPTLADVARPEWQTRLTKKRDEVTSATELALGGCSASCT